MPNQKDKNQSTPYRSKAQQLKDQRIQAWREKQQLEAKDQIDPTPDVIPTDVEDTSTTPVTWESPESVPSEKARLEAIREGQELPLPPIIEKESQRHERSLAASAKGAAQMRFDTKKNLVLNNLNKMREDLNIRRNSKPLGVVKRFRYSFQPTLEKRLDEMKRDFGPENAMQDPKTGELMYRYEDHQEFAYADSLERFNLMDAPADIADWAGEVPEIVGGGLGAIAGGALGSRVGLTKTGLYGGAAVGSGIGRGIRQAGAVAMGMEPSENPKAEMAWAAVEGLLAELFGTALTNVGTRVLAANTRNVVGKTAKVLMRKIGDHIPALKLKWDWNDAVKTKPHGPEIMEEWESIQQIIPKSERAINIRSFPWIGAKIKLGMFPYEVSRGRHRQTLQNIADKSLIGGTPTSFMNENRSIQVTKIIEDFADRYNASTSKEELGAAMWALAHDPWDFVEAPAVKTRRHILKMAKAHKLTSDPSDIVEFLKSRKLFGIAGHRYAEDVIKPVTKQLVKKAKVEPSRIITPKADIDVLGLKEIAGLYDQKLIDASADPNIRFNLTEEARQQAIGIREQLANYAGVRQSDPTDPFVIMNTLKNVARKGKQAKPLSLETMIDLRSRVISLVNDLGNTGQKTPRGHVLMILKDKFDKAMAKTMKESEPELHGAWIESNKIFRENREKFRNIYMKKILERGDESRGGEFKWLFDEVFKGPKHWQAMKKVMGDNEWKRIQNFVVDSIMKEAREESPEIVYNGAKLLRLIKKNPYGDERDLRAILKGAEHQWTTKTGMKVSEKVSVVDRMIKFSRMLRAMQTPTQESMGKMSTQMMQMSGVKALVASRFSPGVGFPLIGPTFVGRALMSQTGFDILTRSVTAAPGSNELAAAAIRMLAFTDWTDAIIDNYYRDENDKKPILPMGAKQSPPTGSNQPLPAILPLVHPQYQ
jgi:hypothetical protein